MFLKRKVILQLIGDIGLIAAAIVFLVIGKYYSSQIPPMAFVFLSHSVMWLIWGTVRLYETLSFLDWINEQGKRKK